MHKEKNLQLDKFLKISIIIGIVLISTSVFYYFVISPSKEKKQTKEFQSELIDTVADNYDNLESVGNEEKITRDAIRIDNIKTILTALVLFYDDSYATYGDKGMYPESLSELSYILEQVPTNPKPDTDSECAFDDQYRYVRSEDGQFYDLSFCLEVGFGEYNAGKQTIERSAY